MSRDTALRKNHEHEASSPLEVMAVFFLPILLLLFVLPLICVALVVSAAMQPEPQRVVRPPCD
jgi:hypothetical protein